MHVKQSCMYAFQKGALVRWGTTGLKAALMYSIVRCISTFHPIGALCCHQPYPLSPAWLLEIIALPRYAVRFTLPLEVRDLDFRLFTALSHWPYTA